MEGSGLSLSGGGELSRSPVKESGLRWREAIAGGRERSQVGWEWSQVEGSGLRWRGAVSAGGERSQVEGELCQVSLDSFFQNNVTGFNCL